MLTKTLSDAVAPTKAEVAAAAGPGTSTHAPAKPAKRPRDPRLDFFRGIGMFIILMAHIPNNTWTLWIPARFGFSDATEIFVFLSGMASSLAFGRVFDGNGFVMGLARIAQRVWQVYWAHIGVFLSVAALLVWAGDHPTGGTYYASLNLQHFFADPAPLLVALMTLRYVPNYLDILPMYLVILAMIPVMLGLERIHRALPFVAMAAIWGLAQAHILQLSAEPWSDRPWFFNPFGWQLIFFTGFFLMRRVLPAPPVDKRLIALAIAVLLATIPFAWYRILENVPALADAARTILPLTDKTSFGILRFVHFLALAYLASCAAGEGGRRLKGAFVRVVSIVGQQSLAVFMTSMVSAQAFGIALDHYGRGEGQMLVTNLLGIALLLSVALTVRWFKAAPWKG